MLYHKDKDHLQPIRSLLHHMLASEKVGEAAEVVGYGTSYFIQNHEVKIFMLQENSFAQKNTKTVLKIMRTV